VVIGLSIWILVDSPSFLDVLEFANADVSDVTIYSAGVIVLLVVACLAFLLSCFGCVGAARENKCMLITVSNTNI